MKKISSILIIMLVFIVTCYVKTYAKDEIVKKEINQINQGYDYNTNNIFKEDNKMIVYGFVKEESNEEEKKIYPYIALFIDNILSYYIIEYKLVGFIVCDVIIYDDYIYSSIYNKSTNNSYIYKYSLNSSLVDTKEYLNCKIQKIHILNDKLYVTGSTKNNNFYNKKTTNNEVFTLMLSNNLEYIDIIFIGNDKDNEIIDSILFKDEVVLLCKIDGKGINQYNKLYPYLLITVTQRLDQIYYADAKIDEYIVYNKLLADDNYIYLFTHYKMYNTVLLSKYDESLNLTKEMTYYKGEDDEGIINVQIVKDNKLNHFITSIFYSKYKEQNQIHTVIRNEKEEILDDFTETIDYYLDNILSDNGIIYDLISIHDKNINYKIIKKAHVKIDSSCYFNGIKVLSEIENNPNKKFGYYDALVTYTYEGLTYSKVHEVYNNLYINITNGSEYNKGYELVFNGDGLLNGKEIKSGYKVNEEGNYVLEIFGEKDEKYYHFKVLDMKKTNDEKILKQINLQNQITQTQINEDKQIEITNNNSSIYKICIIVVFIIFGVSLSFVKIRRKYV